MAGYFYRGVRRYRKLRFRPSLRPNEQTAPAYTVGGYVQIRVAATPNTVRIFNDPDDAILGGLRIEEEYAWPAQLFSLPPNRQPILDTEEDHAASLGGFRREYEDYAPPSVCPILPNNQQPLTDTDALAIAPATIVDEEYWAKPAQTPHQEHRWVFTDTDELAIAAATGVVDEDYWIRPQYIPFVYNRQPIYQPDEWVRRQSTGGGGHPRFVIKPGSTIRQFDQGFGEDAWVPFDPTIVPPVVPADTTGGGWKPTIWDPGYYRPWPQPEPEPTQEVEAKKPVTSNWLSIIEKKPLTHRGLVYIPPPAPAIEQQPKLHLSAEQMEQLRKRTEEEEIVYILASNNLL